MLEVERLFDESGHQDIEEEDEEDGSLFVKNCYVYAPKGSRHHMNPTYLKKAD